MHSTRKKRERRVRWIGECIYVCQQFVRVPEPGREQCSEWYRPTVVSLNQPRLPRCTTEACRAECCDITGGYSGRNSYSCSYSCSKKWCRAPSLCFLRTTSASTSTVLRTEHEHERSKLIDDKTINILPPNPIHLRLHHSSLSCSCSANASQENYSFPPSSQNTLLDNPTNTIDYSINHLPVRQALSFYSYHSSCGVTKSAPTLLDLLWSLHWR